MGHLEFIILYFSLKPKEKDHTEVLHITETSTERKRPWIGFIRLRIDFSGGFLCARFIKGGEDCQVIEIGSAVSSSSASRYSIVQICAGSLLTKSLYTISIIKPTRCTNVSNLFYFWNNTLHVSDGLSVHHQEFKTVHTATGICQTDTAVYLLSSTR